MAKLVRIINLEDDTVNEFLIEWPVKSLEILSRQMAYCLSNATEHLFDFSDFVKYKANINNLYLYKVMAMQNFKIELEDIADEPCYIEIKVHPSSPPIYRTLNDMSYQIEDIVRLPVSCDMTDKDQINTMITNFLNTTYIALQGGSLSLNKVGKTLCDITVVPKLITKVS